jgi:hypothetical protein
VKRVLCAVDLSDVPMDVLHYGQTIVQGYRRDVVHSFNGPTPVSSRFDSVR